MTRETNWLKVRKDLPCRICGKADWCKVSADGAVALCGRVQQGSFQEAKGGTGYLHRLIEKATPDGGGRGARLKPKPVTPALPARDWKGEAERLRAAMDAGRSAALAEATGIPPDAWALLSPGWAAAEDLRTLRAGGKGWPEDRPDGAWIIAEHDGGGRIVGLALRAVDGPRARRPGQVAG